MTQHVTRHATETSTGQPHTPDRLDRFELGAALATGVLHLIIDRERPKGVFIVLTVLFWLGFVLIRVYRDAGNLRRWGFATDPLPQAFAAPTALFVVLAAALGAYAWREGRLQIPSHALVLFSVYPIWGLVQQFLVQGLVVANLSRTRFFRGRVSLVLAGALLFGLVHFPEPIHMAATFALGLFFVPLYLRWRSLWPLGLYHGWLGVLFYSWMLGKDPWAEAFGRLASST